MDGTLIPFAPTPDAARPGPEQLVLLDELSKEPGVTVAIVSGRPRGTLESYFAGCEEVLLGAEHGGWLRTADGWQPATDVDPHEIDDLAAELEALVLAHPGALLERKTWSLAFHFRRLAATERSRAVAEAEQCMASWLTQHPRFEELHGAELLEVRPANVDKGSAVHWVRARAGPGARLIALGDDVTDEDMFGAIGEDDVAIVVGKKTDRVTLARFRLESPTAVVAFLRWLLAARRGSEDEPRAYPAHS
jgi:trehalose-phosphatase